MGDSAEQRNGRDLDSTTAHSYTKYLYRRAAAGRVWSKPYCCLDVERWLGETVLSS